MSAAGNGTGGGGGGGYWIDPEEGGFKPVKPPQEETPVPVGPRRESRARPRRRRSILMWMSLSVVLLAALAVVAVLVWTGEVVIPGLSARLFPIHYQAEIAQVADKYDQDPYLVAAIVKTESGYDNEATSSSGAVGLMQLMPSTAEWVASKDESWPAGEDPVLTDPVQSLELGVWYLAYLGDIYGEGSLAALAAYNGGMGNVDEWIAEAGGLESFDASDIQFPETRGYVERIEHYLDLYRRVHPDIFSQAPE